MSRIVGGGNGSSERIGRGRRLQVGANSSRHPKAMVVITWSHASGLVAAEAIRESLKIFSPPLKLWMSKTEIKPGALWHDELLKTLRESQFNIICLTQESLSSPWLMFEAGAVAAVRKGEHKRVFPILIGVGEGLVPDPLRHYQHLQLSKESWSHMIETLFETSGVKKTPPLVERIHKSWTTLKCQKKIWRLISVQLHLEEQLDLIEGYWYDVHRADDGDRITVLQVYIEKGEPKIKGTEFDANLVQELHWEAKRVTVRGNHVTYPFVSRFSSRPPHGKKTFIGHTELEFDALQPLGGAMGCTSYIGRFTNNVGDVNDRKMAHRLRGQRVPPSVVRKCNADFRRIAALYRLSAQKR